MRTPVELETVRSLAQSMIRLLSSVLPGGSLISAKFKLVALFSEGMACFRVSSGFPKGVTVGGEDPKGSSMRERK